MSLVRARAHLSVRHIRLYLVAENRFNMSCARDVNSIVDFNRVQGKI
jgi:hypothetical protein